MKRVFSGPAVKAELVTLMLEKWGLHPEFRETSATPDLNDLDRNALVFVPAPEEERAREILFGASEFERAEF
jgi:hypothetical protein